MAVTQTVTPTYPVPRRQTSIVFGLTGGGNFVRVWCTSAPDGSDLRAKLDALDSDLARHLVYEEQGGSSTPWLVEFDRGGVYTFAAQEYQKGAAFTGGYENDPRGARTETKIGSETTLTLDVGQRCAHQVGFAADTATLVFYVFGATIRATTRAIHGEESPAIAAPSSTKMAAAALTTDVVATVDALADAAVATVFGSPATIVADMSPKLRAHMELAGSVLHAAGDFDNRPALELASAPTPGTLVSFVNAALRGMKQHVTNDYGRGPGSANGVGDASPTYHAPLGTAVGDVSSVPLVGSASTPEQAYAYLADIYRTHEAHRVKTSVHIAADSTNVLTALPALLQVHLKVFTELAKADPAVPPGESTGMALLKGWGFKEG